MVFVPANWVTVLLNMNLHPGLRSVLWERLLVVYGKGVRGQCHGVVHELSHTDQDDIFKYFAPSIVASVRSQELTAQFEVCCLSFMEVVTILCRRSSQVTRTRSTLRGAPPLKNTVRRAL